MKRKVLVVVWKLFCILVLICILVFFKIELKRSNNLIDIGVIKGMDGLL